MNERYYIGSAKNFETRMKRHLYMLRKNKHVNPKIQAIYNKYGDILKFEILESNIEIDDLYKIEQRYLDDHYGTDNCVNLSPFARGGNINQNPWQAHAHNKGSKRSEETKALQSKSAKEYHKNNPQAMESIREKAWAASEQYRKSKERPFLLVKDGIEYGPFNKQKDVYSAKNKLISNEGMSELFLGKREVVKGFRIKFVSDIK